MVINQSALLRSPLRFELRKGKAVGSQQSAVGSQQSAVGSQQSAVNSQLSAVNSRQSPEKPETRFVRRSFNEGG